MPLSVVCPTCAATVLVPDEEAGGSARCQGCGLEFGVPEVAAFTCAACGRHLDEGDYRTDAAGDNFCADCWDAGAGARLAPAPPPPLAAGLIDVPCPLCRRTLSVAAAYAGTTIRCPHPDCGAEAYVPPVAPPAAAYPPTPPGAIGYQTPAGFVGGAGRPLVPTHMAKAILVTLLCFAPAGIVALVYAAQASSRLAAGDVGGAAAASARADTWSNVGMALGAVGLVLGSVGVILFGGF